MKKLFYCFIVLSVYACTINSTEETSSQEIQTENIPDAKNNSKTKLHEGNRNKNLGKTMTTLGKYHNFGVDDPKDGKDYDDESNYMT